MGDNEVSVKKDDQPVNAEVEGVTASTIYEGGSLSQINAEHLKDNITAIRQLINSHNLVAKDNSHKEKIITSLYSQIEYLRTSPFISIIAGVINIVASILVGIGVNLLTTEKPDTAKGYLLLVLGSILVLLATLATIFYPYVRGWFNKK